MCLVISKAYKKSFSEENMFINNVYFYNEKEKKNTHIWHICLKSQPSHSSLNLVAAFGPRCNQFLLSQLCNGQPLV